MPRIFGGAAALVVAIGMALVINTTAALAYQPGTLGYDISYPQCGSAYPASWGSIRVAPPAAPMMTTWRGRAAAVPVSSAQAPTTTTPRSAPIPQGVKRGSALSFGIIGVDDGRPFGSNPGNPCLADEYAHAPNPALYVNTGYDTTYEDANHTLPECTTLSAAPGVGGTPAQKKAWAVGCSEAKKDLTYVTSQGITNAGGWWLDVETGNSWCGQHGVTCDLSLNSYSIQGLIDTLLAANASPVGIYSNKRMWSLIVGTNTVHGQTGDWYATGTGNATAAAPYCAASFSFSGAPVKLVQFVNRVDFDYACQ
jgi:hypothetical protein